MKRDRRMNAEQQRLEEQRTGTGDWRLWGTYLSERAWGTVREDYSPHGEASIIDPPFGQEPRDRRVACK